MPPQVLVLFNLHEELRGRVMQGMPHEWRAQLLVSMSGEMRKEARGAIGEQVGMQSMYVVVW